MPVTPMPEFCYSLSEEIDRLLRNEDEETFEISMKIQQFAHAISSNPINNIINVSDYIDNFHNDNLFFKKRYSNII